MDGEDKLIGQQIGNYCITAKIAAGSFGTVYRAHHHILTNRVVAIKVLHLHLPDIERKRFVQEAQFLESLHHRHILSITDIGFDGGMPYLTSEYASGGSLHQLLGKTAPRLLSWERALTILTQVGEGLHYAHQQNIVHCDLKPANILFNVQGEAVLADFGIATVLSTLSVKRAAIEGTPPYMAPEQFTGEVSKESDQYALACIAYELATGQRPFSAANFVAMGYKHVNELPTPLRKINPRIAPHVEQAILKALEKQRKQRFADVTAFIDALRVPPIRQLTKEEWLKKGGTLYELKRYDEALAACEHAIRLDPNYASAYNGKGAAMDDLKRYDEALAAYEHALRLDPNFALAYYHKGNTLYNLKRYDEALAAYEHALRLNPNFAFAYNSKGLTLRNLKRYDEALAAFEHALRLNPNDASAYYDKGLTLYNLKRYNEALAAFEHALRLDPNYAFAYNGKGNALRNLKRYNEALTAYEHALSLDPNYTFACYNKGITLHDLKRYDEALVTFEHALRLDPNYAFAYNNKGFTLYNLKRYDEALVAYEHALRLDPAYARAYYNKALIHDRLGQPIEAQKARDKAKELGLS